MKTRELVQLLTDGFNPERDFIPPRWVKHHKPSYYNRQERLYRCTGCKREGNFVTSHIEPFTKFCPTCKAEKQFVYADPTPE